MSKAHYPQLPWRAEPADRDEEMFRVVRGKDGRPIFFISRWLSPNEQEDVANLVTAAPELLVATRAAFFEATDRYGENRWTDQDWRAWRRQIGPVVAELWPADWRAE